MLAKAAVLRSAAVLVPALCAALLVWQLTSGRIFLYINERTFWLLALSVPLLVAMALVHLLPGRATFARPRGLLLLAVPLVFAVLAPPRPLGSAAIENTGPAAQASGLWDPSAATILVTTSRTWDLKQLGLLRAQDPGMRGLDGHHASLLGFVYHPHGQSIGADEFLVGRFVVRCCTADAVATSFPVRYVGAAELPADMWVEVRGTIHYASEADRASPFVEADQVETVPQPERPYLTLP